MPAFASRAARPGRGLRPDPLEAELHDRPVLAEDRREIRHGADRREVRERERGVADEQSAPA